VSTVFVVQESIGKNILSASEFGEIEVLLPPGNIAFSSGPTVKRLKRNLRLFNDEDFLLLMGDPAAIAIASAVATQINNGRMNLLKWDRQERKYYPVKVDVYAGGSNDR